MTVTKFGIFNSENDLMFSNVKGTSYTDHAEISLEKSLKKKSIIYELLSKNALNNT